MTTVHRLDPLARRAAAGALPIALALATVLITGCADDTEPDAPIIDRLAEFQQAVPNARVQRDGDRITRLYGTKLARGANPIATAESFLGEHAQLFGTTLADLHRRPAPATAAASAAGQPLMYDRDTGDYRFTLVVYDQTHYGLPVFGADVRLLVANRDDALTLVASSLRDLADFVPSRPGFGAPLADEIVAAATATPYRVAAASAVGAPLSRFTAPQPVIWAGAETTAKPREAVVFVADNLDLGAGIPLRYRFVADADTGAILHKESLIHRDVSGSVHGLATPGHAAAECADEESLPLPYSLVSSDSTWVLTDASGDFYLTDSSGGDIEVASTITGNFFAVTSATSPSVSSLSQMVAPDGVVDFLHNPANTEELLARVNGYLDANRVRDWALSYHPSFPVIADQVDFSVVVNRDDGYCPGNAWYDSYEQSINFCLAGESYGEDFSNSAFGSIIYHEYGHHMVESGGSGQSEYGEGMSDVVAALLQDQADLAVGFYLNQCSSGLRNADNDCQYDPYDCSSCGWESHDCGNLLSGAVWSIRQELAITEPEDGLDILSALAINSIPLHYGSSITPSIAIDFLTLDDDDGDLDTGSPHWFEICDGFEAHGLTCPELVNLLTFTLPADVTEGDGVLIGQGEVSIVVTPTEPRVVNLSSSDTSELQVPATVTIPAGLNSVTFDITVMDDAVLDGSHTVTIDATAASAVPGSRDVVVNDDESATLTLTIPASATEGDGVLAGQGIIEVSATVDDDVAVALSSSDASELTVPTSVIIASGTNSATFDVTVVDDDLFDDAQSVTVTAAVTNWTGADDACSVADDEEHVLTITAPTSLAEDAGAQVNGGTVSIPGRMTTPMVVSLATSDSGLITVPAEVTIPAMATSAPFTFTVVDDNTVEADATATLTATATSFTGDTTDVAIRNDDVDHFVFATIADPQHGGVGFAIQVDGVNGDGDLVADYHKGITLSASGDGGGHPMTPAAVAALAGGRFSGSAVINAIDSNVVLSAVDGAGRTGTSAAFDLVAGPVDRFEIEPIDSPQLSRGEFSFTATAVDAHDFLASDYTGTASITTRLALPTQVLITEIEQGATDWIEIQNLGDVPVDVTGWRVVVSNSTTESNATNPLPWQLTGEMAAGEVRYATDDPSDHFFGTDLVWRDGSPGWAMLLDDADHVVDLVVWGWDPTTLSTHLGTTEFAFGDFFSGSAVSANGNGSIQRIGQEDHDGAGDFARGELTQGVANPDLTLPFRPGILEISPATTTSFTAGEWDGMITLVGATDGAVLTIDDGAGHVGHSLPIAVAIAAACVPDPCANGAVCVPDGDSYQCQCPTGYEGQDCDQDIDECATTPCDANATCINTVGSYQCDCNAGYSGDGTTCAVVCGDSEVGPGEQCDEGTANSDTVADACRTTCQAASCGDSVVDDGEECDMGSANVAGEPGSCNLSCAIEVDDGGGCGCSSSEPGGWFLLFLVALPLFRRRRARLVA